MNAPIHSPAQRASEMSPPLAPLLVGDQLALDFLNTTASPRGAPIEWIATGRDFVGWLRSVDLLDDRDVESIGSRIPAADLDTVASEAIALREWFRGVLARIKQSGRAALLPEDLARLNRVLAHEASVTALEPSPDGHGLRMVSRPIWRSAGELLVPIAAAMADVLAEGEMSLVRRCENPACTLWFYDRTKGHRRRWCSPSMCGNRAKVAAFRVRKRLKA